MPGLRVLVSTDDQAVMGMFHQLATRRNDLLLPVGNDEDLLTSIEQESPDLIVIDLDSRPSGGLRLLNELSQRRSGATVVLTGTCHARTLGAARRLGLQRGLSMGMPLPKPIDERLIVGTVLDFIRADDLIIRPNEIEDALRRNEFELHYQPLVDLSTNRLWGAEALLRWRHPEFGMLPPDLVIPVAERHGLIGPLTRWVAHRAMNQLAMWDHGGEAGMRMTINVAAQVLRNPDFADEIATAAAETGIEMKHLVLEITESQMLTEEIDVLDTLTRLRLEGIELAVDDFGTGYSSLGRLHRMPFSELKIDKSFVMEAAHDPEAEAIVHAIAELGRILGMTVIAEGVESREAWELVQRHGCDVAQGYFISRPLCPEDFAAWQARWFPGGQAAAPGVPVESASVTRANGHANGSAPVDETPDPQNATGDQPVSHATPIFGPPDDAA